MNEHPHDSLPAFALGALDADEASQVIEHVSACPTCRDDAEVWGAVVALLPYSTPLHDPPAHVKRQLLGMIVAAAATSRRAAHSRRLARWLGATAALSLAVTLALTLVMLDTRGQLDEDQRIMQFLAAPETVGKPLAATSLAPGARGKMYMRLGGTQAMLLVAGLPQPEAGKTYQCWFASPPHQTWAVTLNLDRDGAARLFLDVREPLDKSTQVMVTLEPSGGSSKPSNAVVLAAQR
jgi:anti-sigma-K factor RskA